MTTARWAALVGWVALAASGCTCGVRLCTADSDCGPSATCDPSAGVCIGGDEGDGGMGGGSGGGTGGGQATDTVVSIRMPAIPARPMLNGTVQADVPAAWRRTEAPFVWIESSRPLTQVTLKVDGVSATPAGPAACTSVCLGHCSCFGVDLAKPPLGDLRGTFTLEASGLDPGGKPVTATARIPVTRLLWRRALGAGARATPAIGPDGTVYAATADGKAGALIALAPDGQQKWSKPVGRVDASPIISGGRVLVGATTSQAAQLAAFDSNGTQVGHCALSKDYDFEASPAAITGGAAFFANEKKELIAFRPGVPCTVRGAGEHVPWPDGLVASGSSVFFVDDKAQVNRFDLGMGGWAEFTQNQWPGNAVQGYRNRGLALADGRLIGAGDLFTGGTVFQAMASGTFKFEYGFFPPRVPSSARAPVVAANGLVLSAIDTGIAAVSDTATEVGLGDRVLGAPVLGEGGRLYALAENGAVSAWTYANGKPVRTWSAALDPGAFDASPTLDCARGTDGTAIAGRPGVLYAASRAGTLYAIAVDSRGLDPTAPWPKYQRDPRNSGSGDTVLADFSCP